MTEVANEGLQAVKENPLMELQEMPAISSKAKTSIYLVSRGLKPAGDVELHYESGHESYTEDDFMINIQALGEILYNLDLPYVFDNQIEPSGYTKGVFTFGKDEESLQELLDAFEEENPTENTLRIGRALGYPETAIQGVISNQKLLPQNYPEELAHDEATKFAVFTFSQNHWKEELKVVKKYAEEIKRTNPQLYEEIVR